MERSLAQSPGVTISSRGSFLALLRSMLSALLVGWLTIDDWKQRLRSAHVNAPKALFAVKVAGISHCSDACHEHYANQGYWNEPLHGHVQHAGMHTYQPTLLSLLGWWVTSETSSW
jgi:hypothetical protein